MACDLSQQKTYRVQRGSDTISRTPKWRHSYSNWANLFSLFVRVLEAKATGRSPSGCNRTQFTTGHSPPGCSRTHSAWVQQGTVRLGATGQSPPGCKRTVHNRSQSAWVGQDTVCLGATGHSPQQDTVRLGGTGHSPPGCNRTQSTTGHSPPGCNRTQSAWLQQDTVHNRTQSAWVQRDTVRLVALAGELRLAHSCSRLHSLLQVFLRRNRRVLEQKSTSL